MWSGIGKPTMECFLQPVVGELKYLYECGFVCKQKPTQFVTKVILGLICCDSVARPLLQNFKQFNGMFGCSFCLHPGTNVAKGRGTVHVYPCTLENEYENRSHKQTLEHAKQAEKTKTVIFGVKGSNILSLVLGFNVATDFNPEFMHSVLLGVTRQFTLQFATR